MRRVELAGARELAAPDLAEHLADVALEGGLAGQQAVEGGAQAVDVAARPEAIELAGGLLGAHVGGRAQGAAGQGLGAAAGRAGHQRPLAAVDGRLGLSQRLGQAPIDHERLAVLADDHVARLDVAMEHAPAVGVLDGVADVDEPPQQVAQLERAAARVAPERRVGVESLDRLLEAVSPDEPHRVVRPLAVVGPQAVDRDDARVLQPAGDLGLEQEATAAVRVVGVAWEDLLEGDLAVELGVEGDEDGAQTARGVGPEDAEPLAVGGGRAHGKAASPLGVVGVGFGCRTVFAPGDPCERGLDVGLAERGQAGAGGAVRWDRG